MKKNRENLIYLKVSRKGKSLSVYARRGVLQPYEFIRSYLGRGDIEEYKNTIGRVYFVPEKLYE